MPDQLSPRPQQVVGLWKFVRDRGQTADGTIPRTRTATPAEAISTIERGYDACAGTYEVQQDEGYVVHRPELALGPNHVGHMWRKNSRWMADYFDLLHHRSALQG